VCNLDIKIQSLQREMPALLVELIERKIHSLFKRGMEEKLALLGARPNLQRYIGMMQAVTQRGSPQHQTLLKILTLT